jgi:hypothetical protein
VSIGVDLEKAVRVEVLPDLHRRAVTERDIVLHPRTPQIEIAVFQPQVLVHLRVVGDREGGHLGVVEQADLARLHLDLAGRHLRVGGLAPDDLAEHRDHELAAQPLGVRHQPVVLARDDLGKPVPVAQIDEHEVPEIAGAVHPSEEDDLLADVLRGEFTARVRAGKVTERRYFHLHH